MIPARRTYSAVGIALAVAFLIGRFSFEFEIISLLAPILLILAYFALCAFADAGKPKPEAEPDPFTEAADGT